MKPRFFMMLVALAVIAVQFAGSQMVKREDALWARVSAAPITLDGKLTEPAWAVADSIRLQFGRSAGRPGGGWVYEDGARPPSDPTDALFKFLVHGDSLYIGVVCKDKSIGGVDWPHYDGFLMGLRWARATGFNLPTDKYPDKTWDYHQAYELVYLWGWVDTMTTKTGGFPGFGGWDGNTVVAGRPDSLKKIWDAVTTVQGTTNNDAGNPDTSYTIEFKINLKEKGYNVANPQGEVIMWSTALWDDDYMWPKDLAKFSANRVWIESPWSNDNPYGHLNLFVRPDVTTSSGPEPTVGPDLTIPNATNFAAPVIDGNLTESVWSHAPSLQLQYGNAALRNAYPNSGKYRSGQRQYTVNGALNNVVDPNLVTVKYFFKGDSLYLGFDVEDAFVQYINDENRWDGFRVMLNQIDFLNGDSAITPRRLTFIVDSAGVGAKRLEDIAATGWDSLGQAVTVALKLKAGTTVDTAGTNVDAGYTAEMKINLRKFGYPAGRGDGIAFLSVNHYDGDSFNNGSYGTQVWYMRPTDGNPGDGPAWAYLDPATVVSVNEQANTAPSQFSLLGNYPNPFNPSTTIKFALAKPSEVTLEVFDILGRQVSSLSLGLQDVGVHAVPYHAGNLASGAYFYRLKMLSTGETRLGRMMLMK
jgi:hypothetical protein